MAMVFAEMTMSLDGFVADPSDGVEHLFGWYSNGDVAVPTAQPDRTFRTSEASSGHLRDLLDNIGALVSGRRLFDIADGWGGNHPLGAPVFVVTHSVPDGWPRDDAPFTFVTDGLESAIAQAKATAGDGWVGVGGADIAQQCLDAGLLAASSEPPGSMPVSSTRAGARAFDRHAVARSADPAAPAGHERDPAAERLTSERRRLHGDAV